MITVDMEKIELDFKKNQDGLIPAIIQDSVTRKVLMLGYMNEQAYEKTLESGLVTFWSRSRGTLWTKGETSGNYLHVVEIFPDCDSDTLLVLARPDGPTCHRGTVSCFDTPSEEGFIGRLEQVIRNRHELMPGGHYTSHLFKEGVKKISQKVGEEAVETILEAATGDRDRYIYEASDLIYHLLVLNEQMGVSMSDLEKELLSRHNDS
ncbi:MAG: bifunctional phosphoribosyl-AMP cyclohydrolase/phosphoribosyl-ATP diphosphatase HisIE [Bacteroidales bacterium]|nr:bifunctional phosphoribosyl-AMP cyclohydrolase/phosphoribosyl-ATP diphosphatase HisIE [Bacteroidales bacterium]